MFFFLINFFKNTKIFIQQRFEEIESKFNDLRDQIDTIMAEKCLLEKQTQIDSEVKIHSKCFIFSLAFYFKLLKILKLCCIKESLITFY